MNSNRMLGLTTSSQAKSTEKLSSGYKINRAADDAAGLSISEKMRRQVRGLTQASSNAQDGISVVQTAEGALNEVEDMLQRMNELAVKGETGTLTTTDRAAIQAEIRQLMSEVDRVQSTTTFNEMNLLDGSFIKGLQVGAEAGQHIHIISDMLLVLPPHLERCRQRRCPHLKRIVLDIAVQCLVEQAVHLTAKIQVDTCGRVKLHHYIIVFRHRHVNHIGISALDSPFNEPSYLLSFNHRKYKKTWRKPPGPLRDFSPAKLIIICVIPHPARRNHHIYSHYLTIFNSMPNFIPPRL